MGEKNVISMGVGVGVKIGDKWLRLGDSNSDA